MFQTGLQIAAERGLDGYDAFNEILFTPISKFLDLFGEDKPQQKQEDFSQPGNQDNIEDKQAGQFQGFQGQEPMSNQRYSDLDEDLSEEGTVPIQLIMQTAFNSSQQPLVPRQIEKEHICEKCKWMRQSISGLSSRCLHKESKCAQKVKEMEDEFKRLKSQKKDQVWQQNKLEKLQPKNLQDYVPVEDMELSQMVKDLENDKQQALNDIHIACQRVQQLEAQMKQKESIINELAREQQKVSITNEIQQILIFAKDNLEKIILKLQENEQKKQLEMQLEQITLQIQQLLNQTDFEMPKVADLMKQILDLENKVQLLQSEVLQHEKLMNILHNSSEMRIAEDSELSILNQQYLEKIQILEELLAKYEDEINTLSQQEEQVEKQKLKIEYLESVSQRQDAHYSEIIKGLQEELQNVRLYAQQKRSQVTESFQSLRPFQLLSEEKEVQTDDFKPYKNPTIEESLQQKVSQPVGILDFSESLPGETSKNRRTIAQSDQVTQTELDFIQTEEEQFSNKEIMQAIKQLSMIILSKRDQLDERTKEVVEKTFGRHFGNVISNYEAKIKELETSYEELKFTMRQESDNYLMTLQKVKKLTDYLVKVEQVLATEDMQQISTLQTQLKKQESDLIKQGNSCQQEYDYLRTEIDSRRKISATRDMLKNQTALYRNLGQEGGKLKQLLNENTQLKNQLTELEEKQQQIVKLESKIKQLQLDKRQQIKKNRLSFASENQAEQIQNLHVSFYIVLFIVYGQHDGRFNQE